MSCTRAPQIHRYHDGELTPGDRNRIEEHLEQCAECRGLLEDLRGVSVLLAGASWRALPEGGPARFRDAWRRARERSVIRTAGWLTGAAAAVLFAALAWPPAESSRFAAQPPATWESAATTPPTELREDGDVLLVAQWMADELSLSEQR